MASAATQEQRETLQRLREILRPLSASCDIRPVCWIGGAGDAGVDYCPECAEAEVESLVKEHPGKEYFFDGGYDYGHESDGNSACSRCGRLLGYSLTHYGLGAEIDHYLECPIGHEMSAGEAYEVDAILEAAEYDREPSNVGDAISIGLTAIAAIDRMSASRLSEISRWCDDGGACQ